MDEIAMIILTVPILYPIILELGLDPIWFCVLGGYINRSRVDFPANWYEPKYN
ncbi:MAG: TRAP transporter large permease subunit [Firmicutes bacterium]|jgi:TRAP-type mannitol/chloroaromatic compound transport system permease large subunit|nr:TRAP transporter large permease subunit [Bacillota bacterium]